VVGSHVLRGSRTVLFTFSSTIIAAGALAPAAAFAEEPLQRPSFGVFELAPTTDVPLAGLATGLAVAWLLADQHGTNDPCAGGVSFACDPGSVNGFDRIATQRSSSLADNISDYTGLLALASPVALELVMLNRGFTNLGEGMLADAVVLGEVLAITSAVTKLMKRTIGRRRPWVYRESERADAIDNADAFESFPSGHASMAFAPAVAGCAMYMRRMQPSAGEAALACLPGLGLAAATTALRVEGGRHFPTDVLAGAAIGAAVGLLVPMLHGDPREHAIIPGIAPTEQGLTIGVSGTF
jgi:membrane-associated phospholipid phosphatase